MSSGDELAQFYKQWKWKRSHLPDRDRFRRPYVHDITSCSPPITLRLKQAKFTAQGFASTIWDSAIVMSRYIEHHAPHFQGKRCLDLSAGCGLVGITLAVQGARQVVATDLPPNIPLLQDNCQQNVPEKVEVLPFTWGEDPSPLQPPFDVIVACDVMYVAEAVDALVSSLRDLCHPAAAGAHAKLDQVSHESADASAPSCHPYAAEVHSKKRLAAQHMHGKGSCGSSSSKRQKGDVLRRAAGDRLEGQQSLAHNVSAVQAKPASPEGKTEPASPEGQQSNAHTPSAGQTKPAGHEMRTSGRTTEILIAHGINRTAEAAFLDKASQHFSISVVPAQEQHPDFHSSDVAVYRLVPL